MAESKFVQARRRGFIHGRKPAVPPTARTEMPERALCAHKLTTALKEPRVEILQPLWASLPAPDRSNDRHLICGSLLRPFEELRRAIDLIVEFCRGKPEEFGFVIGGPRGVLREHNAAGFEARALGGGANLFLETRRAADDVQAG